MSKVLNTITLGRLRQDTKGYPDHTPIFFGAGDLTYYRVKPRDHNAPPLLQIEFNELYEVAHMD
jgi:hypothetical protein